MSGAAGGAWLEADGLESDRESGEAGAEYDELKCSFLCALRDAELREPRHPWSQWYFEISLYHWHLDTAESC